MCFILTMRNVNLGDITVLDSMIERFILTMRNVNKASLGDLIGGNSVLY